MSPSLRKKAENMMKDFLLIPEHWTPKEKRLFLLRITNLSYKLLKYLMIDRKMNYNSYYQMYWNEDISNNIKNPFRLSRARL